MKLLQKLDKLVLDKIDNLYLPAVQWDKHTKTTYDTENYYLIRTIPIPK
jgi:hypothetical protein